MKHSLLALVLTACPAPAPRAPIILANHAAAIAPPPPPATGLLAQARGHWTGTDDDHWTYDLVIRADGRFSQRVIQSDGTSCDQAGTITEEAGQLVRAFDANTCNTSYVGQSVRDGVESIEPGHLVLRMESDYLIRYDRAP
jgi:hypothetical protein